MIRSFYIDNFKSLVDFRLPPVPHELQQFVCLVGLNGAGKTTVLQALDFLSHMAAGKVQEWLDLREWKKGDLISRFLNRQLIHFRMVFEFSQLGRVVWEGAFNATQLRCTREQVTVEDEAVLRVAEQKLQVRTALSGGTVERTYDLPGLQFEGSTLSILKTARSHIAIEAIRDSLASLRSLDMLSPQSMRRRAKQGADIGYGGERLSAYLHDLGKESKGNLLTLLTDFYPQVSDLSTTALRAGWKDLSISERYPDAADKPLQTRARHVSDGLLRVLAVLSQVSSLKSASWLQELGLLDSTFPVASVLFDEIENGINPELMEKLVEHLLKAKCQVIVTTHNPLVLNYLPDDVAKESVMFLYRTSAGLTRAVRLFDLPSVRRKLDLLGPGEVYVDTELTTLPAEAESMLQARVPN